MNCRISHDLMQQTLDGAPVESPDWIEHLRHCADCRSLAAATRRLQQGLHHWNAPQPPADLATRITQRVLRDRQRARRRARQRWAVSLALAASLFIALMLRIDWHGGRTEDENKSQPTVAQNTQTMDQPPTLRESAVELKDLFAALTNQTADETVGQTRKFMANVPNPSMPSVDLKTIEPSAQPFREAGEGVSEGLEPVTKSARRAVDLFLRELPPMEDEPKGF